MRGWDHSCLSHCLSFTQKTKAALASLQLRLSTQPIFFFFYVRRKTWFGVSENWVIWNSIIQGYSKRWTQFEIQAVWNEVHVFETRCSNMKLWKRNRQTKGLRSYTGEIHGKKKMLWSIDTCGNRTWDSTLGTLNRGTQQELWHRRKSV